MDLAEKTPCVALNHHLNQRTESTRYYYLLTMQLLTHRLGKPWQFNR